MMILVLHFNMKEINFNLSINKNKAFIYFLKEKPNRDKLVINLFLYWDI